MNAPAGENEPRAGPSGVRRKRARSSSSDSTSSSSSSSSSSSDKRKRSRRHRHKKNKNRHSKWHLLSKEINELRNIISQPATQHNLDDQISIYSAVSGDLYDEEVGSHESITDPTKLEIDFSFDLQTKLKEPSVPKTPDNFVKMLADVQRFGNPAWSEVRYADTQKLYNHAPGFLELETNGEVRPYDTLPHLAKADKAYAAMTFCALKLNECLQENVRNLLTWAKSDSSNLSQLNSKIEELFLKGDYHKISTDLIQLVCGHRSEIVEVKRDAILKHVKDPVVKMSLNKIPPSNTHIFEEEAFSAALEKSGGVRKAFWPLKSENSHRGINKAHRRPSRGTGTRKFTTPSSGAMPCCVSGSSFQLHNSAPPSRGVCSNLSTNQHQFHNNASNENLRGSFQSRGSRPRGQRGGRGRASSHAPRNQSKRYEQ